MRFALIITAILLGLPARPAFAQYTVSIGGPIAVELCTPRVRPIEGKLTAITDDSIFVARPHQRDLRLARGAVKKLYVSKTEGDMALGGAIVAMDAGVVIGAAGGAKAGGPRVLGRVLVGVVGALAGGAIGLIAGSAIGSHIPVESWVEAPWPPAPSTLSAPR